MSNHYVRIDPPFDGVACQFVGTYVLRWKPEWGAPSVAFVEADEPDWKALAQELAVTLNHFRGERCWYSNDDVLLDKARAAGLEV